MITDLSVGTLIVFKYQGRMELWEIHDTTPDPSINPKYAPPAGSKAYGRCFRELRVGEVVHRCVWKGDTLVSRDQYVLKEGDARWNGVQPATNIADMFKVPAQISQHTFAESTPKWLREAQ